MCIKQHNDSIRHAVKTTYKVGGGRSDVTGQVVITFNNAQPTS